MNLRLMESSKGSEINTWRWGIGLALVAILYVAAVIAFIVVY